MPTKVIRGRAAAPGIAIGPVRRYEPQKFVARQKHIDDVQGELARLEATLEQARQEVQGLSERARHNVGAHEVAIFEAHEMFLNDQELLQQVRTTIQQHIDAAYAWQEGMHYYTHQLQKLNDEYLSARTVDMEDVAQRVLRILQGEKEQMIQLLSPAVIVAVDLTPSATMQFDSEKVRAFCLATGGPTSHVAILAKALGIPVITGLGSSIDQLHDDLEVIVDGDSGEMVLDPDQETLAIYQGRVQASVQAHFPPPYRT